MFSKILIANRGEIACRVIRTCRRLGIATVAVYSDADEHALHVALADEAVHVGAAAARESYLDGEKIIAAARATGAQAIHPGYGFLSENATFAGAVSEAGLVFIGPSAQTMELMGSKARAKATLSQADVPLVPGYHGDDQADPRLAREAKRIGFPIMLKAAAGGGGKGMRIVRAADEFKEALAAARREAQSAFGDERMILERYLERPRHVEVQVFGDQHGSVVHLFERDCSAQRRHQKVIEEAPAPNLSAALRARLHQASVAAARQVNYVGAGTVEFLVAGEECFFLEMNTRLQVEHPVTEAITGLDLVEWQLRVAAGEPLPLGQDAITCQGHAVEARVYAENPANGFLPSSGKINALVLPGDLARIDTGVRSGDTVSMYYDPMIAKLTVHAADRAACLAALQNALTHSFVSGVDGNLAFLQQICAHPAMAEGQFDTGLLDRSLSEFVSSPEVTTEALAAAAAVCLAAQERETSDRARQYAQPDNPWSACDGWRLGMPAARTLTLESGGTSYSLAATGTFNRFTLAADGARVQVSAALEHLPEISIEIDRRSHHMVLHHDGDRFEICHRQARLFLQRHHRFESLSRTSADSGRVIAPMPGKIIEIRATEGDEVAEGDTLALMEAMKMELAIKAPCAGRITQLGAGAGELVEADALLFEIGE